MRLASVVALLSISSFSLLTQASVLPPSTSTSSNTIRSHSPPHTFPLPVVIWHGLGDRYDAPGLIDLKQDLKSRPNLEGIFVHIVKIGMDGASDQKATFFGNANQQIELVCQQLRAIPEIMDESLNPSGRFDAIGFSQGGQLLRGVIERCGGEGKGKGGLNVRNLITLGSQHMGISALPPCPPDSSIFSPCRLMHLSLVHSSIYSSYAQNNIVPAQYFRNYENSEELDKYLNGESFLRDLNNERVGDRQSLSQADTGSVERNQTYKENFERLDKLVLFRFSDDQTVIPSTSAHFTLPVNASSSSSPTSNYSPLPLSSLPLYQDDYIGLRTLDERGDLVRRVCKGVHMQIGKKCWEQVVSWLGPVGDGKGASEIEEEEAEEEAGWRVNEEGLLERAESRRGGEFVIQI